MRRGGAAAGALLTLAVATACGAAGSTRGVQPAGPERTTGVQQTPTSSAGSSGGARPAATDASGARSGSGSAPAAAASAAPRAAGPTAAASERREAASVTLPVPGRYSYRVTGSASSALGDQQIDEQSVLTVGRPNGDRESATLRDKEGSTTQLLERRATGLFLAEMSMQRQGFNETFHPVRSAKLIGARPVTGQTWSWQMRSDNGDYTLRAQMTVADAHTWTTVRGQRVHAVRVTSALDISGDSVTMHIHQEDLASVDGTIVREHSVGDGTAYGMTFHSDTTRRLLAAG